MMHVLTPFLLLAATIPCLGLTDSDERTGGATRNGIGRHRVLEDESGLVLNGNHSVHFERCSSLELEKHEFNNPKINVTATKSFVTFSVCESKSKDECEIGPFFTDIRTYAKAVVPYLPAKREKVCSECQKHCNRGDKGKGTDDGNECALCEEFQCHLNGRTQSMSLASQWAYSVTGCAELKGMWNYMSVYAGLTCNDDGDGIMVDLFLDDKCTVRPTQEGSIGDAFEMDRAPSASKDLIENVVSHPMSCSKSEVTLGSHDDDGRPNQFCRQLFMGGRSRVPLLSECAIFGATRSGKLRENDSVNKACATVTTSSTVDVALPSSGGILPIVLAALAVFAIGGLITANEWRKNKSNDKVDTIVMYEMVGSESQSTD